MNIKRRPQRTHITVHVEPEKTHLPKGEFLSQIHGDSHEGVGHPLVGDVAKVGCLMPTDLGKSIIQGFTKQIGR